MCKPKSHGGLGFKKLLTFNLTLLTKQGWHIHQQENSLLHRLYKARYFPNKTFFESHLGPNPFNVCCNIWETKQWLEKMSIWRIGDGRRVNIWTNQWILALDPNPQTPKWADPEIQQAQVNSLIDLFTKTWHLPIIFTLFHLITATHINKIPLSHYQHGDKLVWREEKNGKFSVSNAYRLIQRCQRLTLGDTSANDFSAPLWKTLWRMRVLKKLRYLLREFV